MKISFRPSNDNVQTEIFFDKLYLGYVKVNVLTQKWKMHPNFSVAYGFRDLKEKDFFSSYEAGKELVKIYNFLFPECEELQESSINLEDMLLYLKMRV